MPKKNVKKSILDQGFEDDGNYDGLSSPEPQQYGITPKSTRKSAAGRSLKRWAPGEDQLLLLYVDQVCVQNNIALPWDAIAVAMEPRDGNPSGAMTGEAVKQHLAKLRSQREGQGQKVPPKVDRATRRRVAAGLNQNGGVPNPYALQGNGMQAATPSTKNKRPSLLAPLTKKEQAVKAKLEAEKTRKKSSETKTKTKAGAGLKTPVKQRIAKDTKAAEDIGTISTLDWDTPHKRARAGTYGEGVQIGDGSPLTKRLRPTYGVNYSDQIDLAGDEDEEDVEHKESVEKISRKGMATKGRGNGMSSGAGVMGRTAKQEIAQYNGGNFGSINTTTPGLGATGYAAPTANMAMGHGGNSYGVDPNYWVQNSSFDQNSNFDFNQLDGSISSSMYGFGDRSAGSSTFNAFGGVPTSSPGHGYDFAAPGQNGIHSGTGFGGLPVSFHDEPLALPTTEHEDLMQKPSQDSALGSSLPQTPANDTAVDGDLSWNSFSEDLDIYGGGNDLFGVGHGFDIGLDRFNQVDGNLKREDAQNRGGFASSI